MQPSVHKKTVRTVRSVFCSVFPKNNQRSNYDSPFLAFCLEVSEIMLIFADEKRKERKSMCTITLSYNENSALARRKLAALMSSGLFTQVSVDTPQPTPEEVEAHRQEVEAFLNHSKKSMSHIIARYL